MRYTEAIFGEIHCDLSVVCNRRDENGFQIRFVFRTVSIEDHCPPPLSTNTHPKATTFPLRVRFPYIGVAAPAAGNEGEDPAAGAPAHDAAQFSQCLMTWAGDEFNPELMARSGIWQTVVAACGTVYGNSGILLHGVVVFETCPRGAAPHCHVGMKLSARRRWKSLIMRARHVGLGGFYIMVEIP